MGCRRPEQNIRINDTSLAGWVTVHDYELFVDASDFDDNKRIHRAEERAKGRMTNLKIYFSFNSAYHNLRNSW